MNNEKRISKLDGRKPLSKEEVITAIKKLAKKLRRTPTLAEAVRLTRVSRHVITTKFLTYENALVECGIYKPGNKLQVDELFQDWATVARKLGKVPSIAEYSKLARYSYAPLSKYFGGWRHVPAGLLQYARAQQLEQEWQDVMQLLAWYVEPGPGGAGIRRKPMPPGSALPKPRIVPDQPIYGAPFYVTPLAIGAHDRKRRDLSVWRDGEGPGVHDDTDPGGVSGWRGLSRSRAGAVAVEET